MTSPGCSGSKRVKTSHATDENKPTAAAASCRGDGAKAPTAKREGMTRLPKMEVTQILSQDPRSIQPYSVEAIRRAIQAVRPNAPKEPLRVLAQAQNENLRKKFIVYQDWIRREQHGKGYVEVTDEFIRDREEEAKNGLLGQVDPCLPDKYFTYFSDEDEDGEDKIVFSLTKKKKAGSDSMEWSEDEDEESDEDEDSESEEDDD